jgi:hypothetical protein
MIYSLFDSVSYIVYLLFHNYGVLGHFQKLHTGGSEALELVVLKEHRSAGGVVLLNDEQCYISEAISFPGQS